MRQGWGLAGGKHHLSANCFPLLASSAGSLPRPLSGFPFHLPSGLQILRLLNEVFCTFLLLQPPTGIGKGQEDVSLFSIVRAF